MKVNFDQVLCNFKGIPLSIENEPVTLKYIAVTALLQSYPDEANPSGVEKFKRYDLAKQIHNGKTDIAVEDIALLKALIGKNFIPIIVGAAFDMLEGNETPAVEVNQSECASKPAPEAALEP